MTDYRYVGVSDSVSFTEEDFSRHGIDDQGEVTFDRDNDFTAELSDGAFEYLRSQGFTFMRSEDFHSFLEERRAAQEAQRRAEVDRGVVTPSEADLAAEASPPAPQEVPARPDGATRDQLSAHAWEHYGVDISGMKKAGMEAELDRLEGMRAEEIKQAESAPGDTEGEGQMGDSTASSTTVPGTGTTDTQ